VMEDCIGQSESSNCCFVRLTSGDVVCAIDSRTQT